MRTLPGPVAEGLRSVGVLVAVLAAVAVGLRIDQGTRAAEETVVLLAPLGLVGLVLAHVADRRRSRSGSLRRRFAVAVSIAVGLVVVAVVVAAQRMFLSHHDAAIAVAVAAVGAVIGVRAAQVFGRGPRQDVEALRAGLARVGAGERDVRLATGARDELALLAEAGNDMIRALDATQRAREAGERVRRELVAAVSHDLRTPLTALRLLVEAIDDGVVDEDPETRAAYLRAMRTHVHALGSLVDDLFELSAIESGAVAWQTERVPIAMVLEEVVEAMRPQAALTGVTLEMRAADAEVVARANPEKLQRVLLNLVQNAIRHTPEDGSVVVLAEAAGAAVEVEVRDDGEGIDAGDRERVFEPFFRGGSEAARTRPGAGLGLAIARAIVVAHGGRIWLVDSAVGARVRFSLPADA